MAVLIFGVAAAPIFSNGMVFAQTEKEVAIEKKEKTAAKKEVSIEKKQTSVEKKEKTAEQRASDGKYSDLAYKIENFCDMTYKEKLQFYADYPTINMANPHCGSSEDTEQTYADRDQLAADRVQMALDKQEKRDAALKEKKAQLKEKFANMPEEKKQALKGKLDAMKQKLQAKLDLNKDLLFKEVVYKLESVCQSSEDAQNEFYSTHAEYDQELLMEICAIDDKDSRVNKLFEQMDDIYKNFVTNTPRGFADMTLEERQLEVQKMRDERKLEREHRQNMSIEEKQAYHDNIREKIQEKRATYVSPRNQVVLGSDPTEIVCDEGKELVLKVSNGMPKCLGPGAVTILMDRGFIAYPE